MARKRYQRGSVRLRGKVWYGRWREDERKPDGEVIRVPKEEPLGTLKELPTKQLAKRELESRINHINALTYRPRTVANFKQFAERWKTSVLVNEKRSSQSSDKSILKVHLVKRWGDTPMKEIEGDPEAVQAWASALKVVPKTQRNIIGLFSRMMDTAITWGYITYNPCARVGLKPLGLQEDEPALTIEEMQKIIDNANGQYKTMYWILAETAVRAGEVLGLGWEHIDLNEKVIRIRRKVWRGEFETVKSKKGVRDFAISDKLAEHLKTLGPKKSGLLLSDQDGNPIDYDHALKEEFQPLLESLGIQKCGFHAFRHGNATVMDHEKVPAKTRMDRMGHEKLDTTLKYTHPVSEDDRQFANRMGDLLTGTVQ